MKKKIIGILICTLLISTILPITETVFAGDENDPEIKDEKGDTLLKHFDIVSAWFFENADETDFLFVSIKVNDLKNYRAGGTYLVEWTSPSGRWASASIIGTRMEDEWRCGDYSEGSKIQFQDLQLCGGTIDRQIGVVTFTMIFIAKYMIGGTLDGNFSLGVVSFAESFTEEFFFRGILFLFLMSKTNLKIAYVTSLASFVLMHPQNFANPFIISTIVQGFLTIEICRRSKNLVGAWVIHGTNRFFSIAIMPFLF